MHPDGAAARDISDQIARLPVGIAFDIRDRLDREGGQGIPIDDLPVSSRVRLATRGDRLIQFEPVSDTRFVGRKARIRQQVARP